MQTQTAGAALPYALGETVTVQESSGKEVDITLTDGYRNRNILERACMAVFEAFEQIGRRGQPPHETSA
jgi:hypothetical protein